MTSVKGSPQFRMRVVPYRPLRRLILGIAAVLAVILLLVGLSLWLNYRAGRLGLSPEQAALMRADQVRLSSEVGELRQQLTQAQMNAEVDRKTSEDLRQQLLARREQIAQLERDIAVYRMMSSRSSRNPLGINFGKFVVKPVKGVDGNILPNLYHLKLVVQKLAEGDDQFTGQLSCKLVGKQDGKLETLELSQLVSSAPATAPIAEKIPLSLKYFQNIETDLRLPEGFEPARWELRVEAAARRNPLVLEQELEWLRP